MSNERAQSEDFLLTIAEEW